MKTVELISGAVAEDLRDTDFAKNYLNDLLQDENPEIFLVGLQDVVKAHGGIAQAAEAIGVTRQALHKALSEQGNPRYTTLRGILRALDLDIRIARIEGDEAA
ncbi:MAG: putative addiction module antidote protein [bacterium]|nr:putative addiction module antidote protein [bacterium]